MDYGWVSLEPDHPQSKGFFVDRENRILFFLYKRGPGYVIDFATALQLSKLREKGRYDLWVNIGGLAVFCAAFFTFYFLAPPLGFKPDIFSIVFLAALITVPFTLFYARKRYVQAATALLNHHNQIRQPRPTPRYISILNIHTTSGLLFFAFLFVTVSLFGGIFLYVAIIEDLLILEKLGIGFAGFLFIGLLCGLVWQYVTEPSDDELWFYEPTEDEIEKFGLYRPADYIGKPKETIGTIATKLGSGAAFLCVVAFGLYAAFYRTPMTAEDLTARFENIAFNSSRINIQAIKKWSKPVTIYIEQASDPNFSDTMREEILAIAEAAQIPASFVSKPSPDIDITINFSPDAREFKDKTLVIWSLETQNTKTELVKPEITIYEGSLRLDQEKDEPLWYQRKAAITAGFIAFGMYGQYQFESHKYEHHFFELVRVPVALTSMFYDPRITPGMTKEQAMPIAHIIATEMVEADSFETWVAEHLSLP